MRDILSLRETIAAARDHFHVYDDSPSNLVRIGMRGVDNEIGGISPGEVGVLAARTGVGKSSLIVASAFKTDARVGIVSLEDSKYVTGSRMWSALSGVDNRDMRKKTLSPSDVERLEATEDGGNRANEILVAHAMGAGINEIVDIVARLGELGCQLIWLDYLQKVRGVSEDRRSEVGIVFSRVQAACDRAGASCMLVSQVSRVRGGDALQIYHLKESGDLENEARLILLAERDLEDLNLVNVRIAKSSFGGENVAFQFRRTRSGVLEEISNKYDDVWGDYD